MPSSIYFKDKNRREYPKAKIKYYAKAVLKTSMFEDNMKYKQVFMIREPPVNFKMNEQQREVANIKTWCCVDQGHSEMWANFEKNIYTPQETARAMINIDNSRCTLNCTQVKFWLEQRLTIRSLGFGGHTYTDVVKYAQSSQPGPNFGQGGYQTEMFCNLAGITYVVDEYKKKRGVQVKISPEDAYMLAGIQSACHSRHITNEYFLKIECEYDGCTCCSNVPDASMPMTVVPIVNP